jgi:predicted Ser/Thr protein kinase
LGAVMRRLGDGVEVVSELGRGTHTAVYRIRRGGSNYALKVLRGPSPGDERAATVLCREAALLARVNHPGVPNVFDVGIADGYPYLVLEFLDGQPLSGLLERGPLPEPLLIRMAAEVAMALAAAHRAGVVHRDIKPANIVISSQSRARLIDFDLATSDRSTAIDESVVGTFHYSPPEQSGMLNRPVDHRADLYALGVVLFQCATGRLPFTADDVGALIAMHANLPAPDPRTLRPDVSDGLAAVIGRLLAKDPDDRMQSAGDLLAALGSLSTAPAHASGEWTGPANDRRLLGRDEEQLALAGRWKQARGGHGGMLLISGAPGSGKTSLAQGLVRTARADGALVLSGKCDVDSSVPLAALRSAVEDWLRCQARLPADRQAGGLARLRAAAGAGAGLLRPLSPLLAVTLDAPILDAGDRHEQFAGAVASFLAALPDDSGGLLVLDDAQWLDAASLAALRRLAEDIAEVPLLVVATVRDDEDSKAGLAALLSAAGDAIDLQVPIGPLDAQAAAHLVSSYLAGSTIGADVIDDLSARGGGNPFTILEYLRSLIDAGALRPRWGTWRLDTAVLQRINLPSGVLDLVLARIDGLGRHTREVLTVAAAIGNVVPTGLLAAVTDLDPAEPLAEASTRGLVHARADVSTFVHDRIREALLSAVDPADLSMLHQRIATALDGQRRTDAAGVYATARHYACGQIDQTPESVFRACSAAGYLALDENVRTPRRLLEAAQAAAQRAGLALTAASARGSPSRTGPPARSRPPAGSWRWAGRESDPSAGPLCCCNCPRAADRLGTVPVGGLCPGRPGRVGCRSPGPSGAARPGHGPDHAVLADHRHQASGSPPRRGARGRAVAAADPALPRGCCRCRHRSSAWSGGGLHAPDPPAGAPARCQRWVRQPSGRDGFGRRITRPAQAPRSHLPPGQTVRHRPG